MTLNEFKIYISSIKEISMDKKTVNKAFKSNTKNPFKRNILFL